MADGEEKNKFFFCECFLTHNIFLKNYGLHVVFHNELQFIKEYRKVLSIRGCTSGDMLRKVVHEIKNEVERRKNLGEETRKRRDLVSQKYLKLHPFLWNLQDSFLDESFKQIVEYAKQEGSSVEGLNLLIEECAAERVYSFAVFTPEFCQALIEELCHFEKSDVPRGRPNTMNNYGVLLNELGFDEHFITPLRCHYLTPLAKLLFPDCGGGTLDSHKAFTVQYKIGQDLDLSYHYDNAEVTLNVCLGRTFTESSLCFGNMRMVPLHETECSEVEHKPCYGVFHRGQQMHAALPLTSGERYNLIIWMRSSSVRNHLCPMCDQRPRLVPSTGFGDGFTSRPVISVCTAQ